MAKRDMSRHHHLFALAFCGIALGGCEPAVSDPFSQGGISPDPVAVMEATLAYTGPRAHCDESGQPLGRFLLFLWSADNPPSPAGSATFPVSAMWIDAHDIFEPGDDCMPAEPAPADEAVFVSRFLDFTWAQIPLSTKTAPDNSPLPQAYIATVTFDRDQDIAPTISIMAGSTQGDVLGQNLAPIVAGHVSNHPNGQVISGVSIGVGLPVNTEPPMSYLAENETSGMPPVMFSESPIPLSADPAAVEAMIAGLTPIRLDMVSAEDRARYDETLEVMGLDISYHPLGYAWYVRDLDADSDGEADAHPFFASFGIPWRTPIVIFQRAQTLAEQAAGFPQVVMVANSTGGKEVRFPSLELALPATAGVLLNELPQCRIPYLSPNNALPVFLSSPAACHELPTGRYTVNVLHGVGGGVPVSEPVPAEQSDTMLDIVGGRFASQRWVIPNAMGAPDVGYSATPINHVDPPGIEAGSAESITIAEQGPSGRLLVADPDPSNAHTCSEALNPMTGTPSPIPFMPVPEECCASIRHFCDLPLCEPSEVRSGLFIREAEALGADGQLPCVPFEMPPSCCTSG